MKRIFFIVGILFVVIAVFAKQFGIDNDEGWGRGRITILTAGVVFTLIGVCIYLIGDKVGNIIEKASVAIDKTISRPNRITIAFILATILTIVAYLWFVQLDQRNLKQLYDYYGELAKSFKNGYLYLADTPPSELLALNNPYDYFLRRELNIDDFPWDVSLYKDKFYLYWGPVPALILTIFSEGMLSNVADFHLALVFACGVFIYMALLISAFWRKSLQHSPAWLLCFLLLVVGLSTPVTIMLQGANIYEAAVFGCQFFFIGGCYWAYSALWRGKLTTWMFAVASIHWALAIGTRVIILPTVIFCAGVTLVYVYKLCHKPHRKLLISIALFLPLILAGFGLAWYNWVRFDSIFEFGLTYQLANIDYTNSQNIFSTSRILQNIDLYFTHPFKMTSKFPYISRIEYINSNDRLAGLIYTAPYILLLSLPIYYVLRNLFSPQKKVCGKFQKNPSENWLFFTLMGSGVISAFTLMSYYFVAMRFAEDFMPALLALITIQIGRDYDSLHQNIMLKRILVITTGVLASITITTNILLAVPRSGVVFMLNFINTVSKIIGLK